MGGEGAVNVEEPQGMWQGPLWLLVGCPPSLWYQLPWELAWSCPLHPLRPSRTPGFPLNTPRTPAAGAQVAGTEAIGEPWGDLLGGWCHWGPETG